MSSNEKITLENLFNLLNSVPSADRQAVIEVVYQAAKRKIDELIENYNQIYGFFDQLTAFAVATGEQFNVKKPKRLDFNKIQDFYVNESTDEVLGANEDHQNLEEHQEPAPESVTESETQKEENATQLSQSDETDPKVEEPKPEGEKVAPESEPKVEDDKNNDESDEKKTELTNEELRRNLISELQSIGINLSSEVATNSTLENLENMLNTFKPKQSNAA